MIELIRSGRERMLVEIVDVFTSGQYQYYTDEDRNWRGGSSTPQSLVGRVVGEGIVFAKLIMILK